VALRGRWRAYVELIAALKGINGFEGGYWNDIAQRVYQVLVRPEDSENIVLPYICAPLILTQPAPEAGKETSETFDVWSWKQPIYYFLEDESDNVEDSAIGEAILKLTEDVIRACALDWTLNGSADDSRFIDGGNEIAGIDPTDDIGEGQLILEVDQRAAPEDLGPKATA